MKERKYKIVDNKLVKKENGVPIPEDEPVFVFRAKDINALPVLLAYHMIINDLKHKAEITKSINDFREFKELHPELMHEPNP